jgi:hypothetical protein
MKLLRIRFKETIIESVGMNDNYELCLLEAVQNSL